MMKLVRPLDEKPPVPSTHLRLARKRLTYFSGPVLRRDYILGVAKRPHP